MANQLLEVLVVGAGIAGLSAAIALGKQGHRVVVSRTRRQSAIQQKWS
jgi:salicylate hydroxylase